MILKQKSDGSAVAQSDFVVPNITTKELLDAIPWVLDSYIVCFVLKLTSYRPHCFKRSALRSSLYVWVVKLLKWEHLAYERNSVWDVLVIGCIYKAMSFLDTFIDPTVIELPHPFAYRFARFALWSLYSFWTGLFATGLWVIGHECGHQAFSESKVINNLVGWFIHSAWVFLTRRELRA